MNTNSNNLKAGDFVYNLYTVTDDSHQEIDFFVVTRTTEKNVWLARAGTEFNGSEAQPTAQTSTKEARAIRRNRNMASVGRNFMSKFVKPVTVNRVY